MEARQFFVVEHVENPNWKRSLLIGFLKEGVVYARSTPLIICLLTTVTRYDSVYAKILFSIFRMCLSSQGLYQWSQRHLCPSKGGNCWLLWCVAKYSTHLCGTETICCCSTDGMYFKGCFGLEKSFLGLPFQACCKFKIIVCFVLWVLFVLFFFQMEFHFLW